ncbi:hypothetical protein SSPIM334S_00416 [Streptomyces spiroverticillatus]
MSTLTHTDVAEVDLTLLGRTAADWNQTASHLKRLAGQARSGLLTKSEHARWDGVNATVTRDFIRKTTKEFTDACTQATTVARILEDAHQELTKIQTAVRHIRDVEAPRLGINLVGLPGMPEPSHNVRQPAVTELNQRLKVLVAHAAEIDASVARALRMSHGDDAHNFGHRTYASLDAAQTERALELARIGPMLSNAQFTELNSILAFNAKDSDFSTAFYQGLGSPKKALEFYARMSLDCTVGDQPERLALAKDLQRAMGTALASATDPDNRAHLPASWAKEFRTLGTQPIPTPALGIDRPYGYQILGGLLRYGEYDPRFINPLAEDILRIHKEDPDFFMETKPTRSHDPDFGFNPSGLSGAGYDPLTSVLEGLGHSPEAAKQFFKDDRHFDDLTRADFPWAPDTLDRSSEDTHEGGPDALGHALEAATTGHPWDDTRPGLHRDAETTAIMRKVVALYSPTSKVEPQDALMDSLGRMGAAYIDDLNYSTLDFGGGGDDLDRDQLFRTDKTRHGGFGEFEARNFMNVVASDEEGYKILSAAQRGLLPGQVAVEQPAGDHAGPPGRPVVLRGVVPVDELLPHRPLHPPRPQRPPRQGGAQPTTERQRHLRVVRDERLLRQLHLPPRPALRQNRRYVVELGRKAERVPEREPHHRPGGGPLRLCSSHRQAPSPEVSPAESTTGLSSGGCNTTALPARYSAAGFPRPPVRRCAAPPTGSTNPGVASTLRRKLGRSNATPHTVSYTC